LRLKIVFKTERSEDFKEDQEVQIKDDLEHNSDQEFHTERVSATEGIMDQETDDTPLKWEYESEVEIKSESSESFVDRESDPDYDVDKELDSDNNIKYKKKGRTKNPHQCSWCGKIYSIPSKLKQHEMTHTASRNFSCDLCDAKFRFKMQIITHMKNHLNLREYKCSICGKAYNKSGILSDHKRRAHAAEKKFECFCGKKFALKYELNRHMICHSGERRYKVCLYFLLICENFILIIKLSSTVYAL
jgi:hypothetical protein